ncbi:unnamed protein product [Hermetia illucens]|uniref:PDZ domain-containing protein n=1 Tax=Hermetia illucens TaxID=343691 RepID=A0A7R8U9K2_HERIL|nr:syntenin-1-like [Hermetia illucens]XP_037927015.1 syntenin-1-like [Hermetia illucens]CAD7076644.1 unnamed protein product [Hermetia illucens]
MSLYPSLEDMQVSKIIETQYATSTQIQNAITASSVAEPIEQNKLNTALYPGLDTFLGLELTPEMIRANMPEYCTNSSPTSATQQIIPAASNALPAINNSIAPLSGTVALPARAHVTHNIREFILCKGPDGKVGLRVQAANNGIFVCIVVKDSPAALAGIRFGDQILQLNGTNVAGYSVDKIHKMLKQSAKNNISVIVRDRPFERTITLMKDSKGNLGFQFKNGKIVSLIKDSSAARNGVLTDHQILEVNGQSVVALKDKDIRKIMDSAGEIVKINIIPTFIYDHMIKKLSTSYLRGIMDHSVPDF